MLMLKSRGERVESCGTPFFKERGRLKRPSLVWSAKRLLEIS